MAKGKSARAVYGIAENDFGGNYGGYFVSTGVSGIGVQGIAAGSNGTAISALSQGSGTDNYGVWAKSNSGTGIHSEGAVYGVWGSGSSTGYDFYAGGPGINYGAESSVRWKSNIVPIDNALSKVLNLRGIYFNWKKEKGGEHDMGMVAEEVGKVLPEIVEYESDGSGYTTGMDYSKLTPVLVEAIKEQQKQIEELKAEVRKLKLEQADID